ncbi:MAG: TIGR00266 family protein [Chloroflexi bacterium]|nr:TIGR00266 family protein [Chloroflexota bacterium]
MEYTIKGTTMPVVEFKLQRGEALFTEAGGMCWMSANIEMKTSGRGGGLGGFLGRALSGESLFLTTFTCQGNDGLIAFGPSSPGQIIATELKEGQSLIAQKGAFLCGQDTVKLEIHFRKQLGAGFFGGEGFIMQKISGPGWVFTEIDGEVIEYTLGAGQEMKVDTGYVAMFEPSVQFDVEMVKGGVKNILFGGEGLFMTTLKGPGRVWLQTLPIQSVASALIPFLPRPSSG